MPDWDIDWRDTRPQKPRSSLTCSDFLPSDSDASELQKRAVLYIMEVLVFAFSYLGDLQKFLPSRKSPHAVQKSVVVPMQILFKDEKYKSETIEILSDLMHDAALNGEPQVNYMHMLMIAYLTVCMSNCVHVHVSIHVHTYLRSSLGTNSPVKQFKVQNDGDLQRLLQKTNSLGHMRFLVSKRLNDH